MGVVAPGARSVERWLVPLLMTRPIPAIFRFAPSSLLSRGHGHELYAFPMRRDPDLKETDTNPQLLSRVGVSVVTQRGAPRMVSVKLVFRLTAPVRACHGRGAERSAPVRPRASRS